jgi:hypothetical protein
MSKFYRRPFVPYDEALEKFTEERKQLNEYISHSPQKFIERFEEIKQEALNGDVVAMDILAYYYKSGVPGLLPENYMRYIQWELIASARGNELAIEKVQFLIGYACDEIMKSEDYDKIAYKNDINDYNLLYVLGKAVSKILVRDFLKAFPIDLVALEDNFAPFKQEYFVTLRRYIDEAVPKTIEFLKS